MNAGRGEVPRIVATMTAVCAIAGLLLGAAFVATHRYREEADRRGERAAILELLQLDGSATVLEIRQLLSLARREVIYRAAPLGAATPPREIVFDLDGRRVAGVAAGSGDGAQERALVPLGRIFAATRNGAPAGFVVEGESRGYKNRIRFFVALGPEFTIRGVRVIEHEEDPGLGAETATPAFQGQYLGRAAEDLPALTVTRDPMPEDWRVALAALGRMPPAAWHDRHAALLKRERTRPIYAVTGATISSRALTDGVRETVDHFRRRWAILAPELGGAS
jgi:electron transport complex protein RnfG